MKRSILNDFLSLFFPNLCLACSEETPSPGSIVCVRCKAELPQTNFHLEKENPFTERFWGRISLHSAASLYYFSKGSSTQKLIHNLKYKGRKKVGIELGNTLGYLLKEAPLFRTVDLIIPVPLHPKKERKRGFNQSDLFAQGLSESMKIPWLKNGLKRKSFTETQTQKTRMERFENVLRVFEVEDEKALQGKHILLVDDVITTGATLEACALKILKVPDTRLSLATIAFANQ